MEPDLATPTLLRGPSALGWQRALFWINLGGLGIIVLSFVASTYGRSVPGLGLILPSVGVPVFVVVFGSRFLSIGGVPREKAEVRAGYTTLFGTYPQVPQLDPRSGAIIRRVGDPLLDRKSVVQRGTAAAPVVSAANRPGQLASASRAVVSSTPTPRPNFLRATWPILPAMVGAMVIFVVVSLVSGRGRLPFYEVLLIAGATLVISFVTFSLGAYPRRRKLDALRNLAPGSAVFTFSRAQDVMNVLASLVTAGIDPHQLPRGPYAASADREAVKLWSGTPPIQFVTIPWSRVTAVSAGTFRVISTIYRTVELSVGTDTGPVSLSLVQPNGGSLFDISPAEATWAAAELNRLRG